MEPVGLTLQVEWRRLHNEKLNSLFRSPIVRVIKSRRLREEELKKIGAIPKFQQVNLQERDLGRM